MVAKTKNHFYMPYVLQLAANGVVIHRIRGKEVETRRLPVSGQVVSVSIDGRHVDILDPNGTLYHICDSVTWEIFLPKQALRALSWVVVAGRRPRVWWCSREGAMYRFYPKWAETDTFAIAQCCGAIATSEYVVEREPVVVCLDETPRLLVVHSRGYVRDSRGNLVIFGEGGIQPVDAVVPEYVPPTPVPQWGVIKKALESPTEVWIRTPERAIGKFSVFGGCVADAKGMVGDRIAVLCVSVTSPNTPASPSVLTIHDLSGSIRFSTAINTVAKQAFVEDDYVYVYAGQRQSAQESVAYDMVHVFSAEGGYVHTVNFFPDGYVGECGYTLVKYPRLEAASDMCLEIRTSGKVPVSGMQAEKAETIAALLVSEETERLIASLSAEVPHRVTFQHIK